MQPVQGGFETHRIRSDDYEAQKRAALAQSKNNSYIQGLQEVYAEGAGEGIKSSRTAIGAPRRMTNEVMQGDNSNFRAIDSPGNRPLDDPINQTASHQLQTSATSIPQQDPQDFETDALDRRLAMMAKGGMNNLNNVPSLYRRG